MRWRAGRRRPVRDDEPRWYWDKFREAARSGEERTDAEDFASMPQGPAVNVGEISEPPNFRVPGSRKAQRTGAKGGSWREPLNHTLQEIERETRRGGDRQP